MSSFGYCAIKVSFWIGCVVQLDAIQAEILKTRWFLKEIERDSAGSSRGSSVLEIVPFWRRM